MCLPFCSVPSFFYIAPSYVAHPVESLLHRRGYSVISAQQCRQTHISDVDAERLDPPDHAVPLRTVLSKGEKGKAGIECSTQNMPSARGRGEMQANDRRKMAQDVSKACGLFGPAADDLETEHQTRVRCIRHVELSQCSNTMFSGG